MRLHQGLEALLFMCSNAVEDDLSQVQTPGLGQGDVERFILSLPGVVQKSRATPC